MMCACAHRRGDRLLIENAAVRPGSAALGRKPALEWALRRRCMRRRVLRGAAGSAIKGAGCAGHGAGRGCGAGRRKARAGRDA